MNMLTVHDIKAKFGVGNNTVYKWISRGWLKGTQAENGRWKFTEEAVSEFIRSDNYYGHPEDILSPTPFRRAPNVEECWPVNLMIVVRKINLDGEEIPQDIWDWDVRKFLAMIEKLTDREKKILNLRYRFGMTLDEVGKAEGNSRERIRLIQKKAERKLAHWSVNEHVHHVSRERFDELTAQYLKLKKDYNGLLTDYEQLKSLYLADPEGPGDADAKRDPIPMTIEEMDFSVRAYNCLKRAGFKTLEDLLEYDRKQDDSERSWYMIRNLGRKSLMEVARKIFDFHGYRIREWDEQNGYGWPIPLSPEEAKVPGGVDIYRGEEATT